MTKTATNTPRLQRQDAQRNRERILEAATRAFTVSGLDTSLEAVAHAAGVGIGTLYRHFPSREALVLTAYRHEVDQLCARADEVLLALPPDQALRVWTGDLAAYVVTKRGMAPVLKAILQPGDPYFAEVRTHIYAALERLLVAASQAGSIRADFDVSDVMQAMNGIWLTTSQPEQHPQTERLLNLLMDGLRYGNSSNDR